MKTKKPRKSRYMGGRTRDIRLTVNFTQEEKDAILLLQSNLKFKAKSDLIMYLVNKESN